MMDTGTDNGHGYRHGNKRCSLGFKRIIKGMQEKLRVIMVGFVQSISFQPLVLYILTVEKDELL